MGVVQAGGLGLPVPAGNAPLSGGGGGSIDFPSGVVLSAVRLSPTPAQLQALAGTPIAALPAPGAGRIVVPFHWTWEVQQGLAITTSPNANIRYAGNATNLIPAIQGGTNNANFYNFYTSGQGGTVQVGVANVPPAIPVPPVNTAVQIVGANMVGGGDSVHRITIFFYILPYVP